MCGLIFLELFNLSTRKLTIYNVFFQVDEVRGVITVDPPPGERSEPPKTFTFDTVFGSASKQVDVYNEVARPIVDCVLEGYNGMTFLFVGILLIISFFFWVPDYMWLKSKNLSFNR